MDRKTWGPRIRRALWDVQGKVCWYCSVDLCDWTGQVMEVEHVIPLSRGGKDELENLCGSCPGCNDDKATQVYPELKDRKAPGAVVAERLKARQSSRADSYTFGRFPTMWRNKRSAWMWGKLPDIRKADGEKYYSLMHNHWSTITGEPDITPNSGTSDRIEMESVFTILREPFYEFYPCLYSMARSVLRKPYHIESLAFPSAIPSREILSHQGRSGVLRRLEIRFPKENPFCGITTAIIGEDSWLAPASRIYRSCVTNPQCDEFLTTNLNINPGTQTVGEAVERTYANNSANESPQSLHEASDLLFGVLVVINLLHNDPRFVERIAGNCCISKKRSKREGIPFGGWSLGRKMEATPHFRRPHFGIRWTGKGRTVPKLTAISASIVNGNIFDIPTGYGFDEEASTA